VPLAYLDESYNDGFYFIGALVVPATAARVSSAISTRS
jgi:hypothetical protein